MRQLTHPLTPEQLDEIQQRLAFQCPRTVAKQSLNMKGQDPHDPELTAQEKAAKSRKWLAVREYR